MSLIQDALEKARSKKPLMAGPSSPQMAQAPVKPSVAPAPVQEDERRKTIEQIHDIPPRLIPPMPPGQKTADAAKPAATFLKRDLVALAILAGVLLIVLLFFNFYQKMASDRLHSKTHSWSSILPSFGASKTESAAPEFTLSGISFSGEGRTGKYAIINGQVAGVGDILKEGAMVGAIQDKQVFLFYKGEKIRLNL